MNEDPQMLSQIMGEIADQLRHEAQAVAFVGAGISLNSGLPIVYGRKIEKGKVQYFGLVEVILERLGMDDEEIQLIRQSAMPFELFIETLQAHSDMAPLFDIFDGGKPNPTHRFVARLLIQSKIRALCTTNFDTLIEDALSEEAGWAPGHEYDLIYRDDDLGSIAWQDGKPKLIKIHGSVHAKDEMAITLRGIAQKDLNAGRQSAIKHLFSSGSHQSVLILGYSSSDIFDIVPHIQAIKEDRKHVFYVEHSSSPKVEPVGERFEKNPFRHFPGERIYTDTDALIERLWPILSSEPYRPSRATSSWRGKIDEWYRQSERLHQTQTFADALMGHLLQQISENTRALAHYRRGLAAAQAIGHLPMMAALSRFIAQTLIRKGDYAEAIETLTPEFLAASLEDALLLKDLLAGAYVGLKQYEKASSLYRDALEDAETSGHAVHQETIRSNLASLSVLMEKPADAAFFLDGLISRAERAGNKSAEGIRLSNLGRLARQQGKYDKAQNCLIASLAIARDIGDRQAEGIRLGDLASTIISKGLATDTALSLYRGALRIAREVGDKASELRHLDNLSQLIGAFKNDDAKAQKYAQQALEVGVAIYGKKSAEVRRLKKKVRRRGSRSRKARSGSPRSSSRDPSLEELFDRALIFLATLDEHRAKPLLKQALDRARALEDRPSITQALMHLGTAHAYGQDYPRARAFLEQANETIDAAGDPFSAAALKANLAAIDISLERFCEARQQLEEALLLIWTSHEPRLELYILNSLQLAIIGQGNDSEQVVEYYDRAVDRSRQRRDRQQEIVLHGVVGELMARNKRFEAAQHRFETAVSLAKGKKLESARKAILQRLGQLHRDLGNPGLAREFQSRSMGSQPAKRPDPTAHESLGNLGVLEMSSGNFLAAEELMTKALRQARRIGDHDSITLYTGHLGILYRKLAEYEKSEAHLREALEACKKRENRRGEALWLENLGVLWRAQRKYDEGLEALESALLLNEEHGDRRAQGFCLMNIGQVFLERQKLECAQPPLERACSLGAELPDRQLEGLSRALLGETLYARSLVPEALEQLELALRILRQSGDRVHELKTLTQIAHINQQRGDSARAHRNNTLALELAIGLDHETAQRELIGWLLESSDGDPAELENLLRSVETRSRKKGSSAYQVWILLILGIVLARNRDFPRARRIFERTIKKARQIRDPLREGEALYNLGSMLRVMGEHAEALRKLEASLRVLSREVLAEVVDEESLQDLREEIKSLRCLHPAAEEGLDPPSEVPPTS